jgi:hypothetical protein
MAGHLKSKRKRTVNLAKLADPQMITLTGLPANRAGFKVIRSATGALEHIPESTEEEDMLDFQKRTRARGTTAKKTAAPKVEKIKRVDTGLLTLILPEGATEDDAAGVIEQFGLTDDYTIVRDDNGRISLVRKEEEGAEAPVGVEVALANNMSAIVDTSMFRSDRTTEDKTEDGSGLVVARIDFNIAHGFETLENIRDYLTENEIDYLKDGVEQVDGGVIVHRAEDYDGKGVKIELAPGITAHVIRGEADNVPRAIRRAVVDAAFGNFGMGHLDFSAALVDPEFSSQAGNAIFQVSDVFDNIVFRSGLPLEERKTLIARAADEFVGFMSGLMDAVGDMGFASASRSERFGDKETDSGAKAEIPNGAVTDNTQRAQHPGTCPDGQHMVDGQCVPVAREDEGDDASGKDAAGEDGSTETLAQEATARSDTDDESGAKDDSQNDGDGEGGKAPVAETITRKDMQDMVTTALEAAGTTFGETLKGIVDSNEETTKRLDKALKTIESLEGKVQQIGDTTVARSDEDDGGSADVDAGTGEEEEDRVANVFKGAFGRSFNPRQGARS